jgi:hypothetical protein
MRGMSVSDVYIFLLSILSMAFGAFVVAETLARLWVRRDRRYYVRRPHSKQIFEVLPEVSPYLRNPIETFCNSDGERGNEVPKVKGKLYRVLAVGESFVECSAITQEKTWPAVLERILRQHLHSLDAEDAHVGNIGLSEMDTQALASMLEKVLPQYADLDLILFGTGFACAMRWLLDGAPSNCAPAPLPAEERFEQYPEMPFAWSSLRQTALAEVTKRMWYRQTRRSAILAPVGNRLISCARQRRKMKGHYCPLTSDPSAMLHGVEKSLRQSIELAKAKAPRIILIRQPWFHKDQMTEREERNLWMGRIGRSMSEVEWKFLSNAALFYLVSLVDEVVGRVAEEYGLETVDLQQLLEIRLGVFYDQCHLTEEGSANVAHHVANQIILGHKSNAESCRQADSSLNTPRAQTFTLT